MLTFRFYFTNLLLLFLLASCVSAQNEPAPKTHLDADGFVTDAYEANFSKVTEYLEKGGDVNVTDSEGYTALIWAASEGHSELVRYLIEKNADVNIENMFGGTALYWAAINEHTIVAQQLLRTGEISQEDKDLALQLAAKNGNIDLAKILIQTGANINADLGNGLTALKLAFDNGQTEMAEYLQLHGAK